MPVAESFTALGAGNGFPLWTYPRKVDVIAGNYTKWSTAGGYTSDSTDPVTDLQISESRRLAMLWFWNSYKVNGSGAMSTFGFTIGAVDTENHMTKSLADNTPLPAMPPKNRIILSDRNSQQNIDNQLSYVASNGDENGDGSAFVYGHIDIGIIEMYKGPVDDYTNFIGYGIEGAEYSSYMDDTYIAEVGIRSLYQTLGPEVTSGNWYSRNSTFGTFPIGNDNIHVVKWAWAENDDFGPSVSASSANLTASDGYGESVSMTSMDLYTYA